MTQNDNKYIELNFRKTIINDMIKKVEDELKNKAMLMFAKSSDKESEEKQIGAQVLLKRWLDEIKEEIRGLENDIFNDIVGETVQHMKDKLNK